MLTNNEKYILNLKNNNFFLYFGKIYWQKFLFFVFFAFVFLYFSLVSYAYFSAKKLSVNNSFESSSLDIAVLDADNFTPKITFASSSERVVRVKNVGKMDFKYNVYATNFSDADFCQSLDLEVYYNGALLASSSLEGFNLNNLKLLRGKEDLFDFKLRFNNENSLSSSTCEFDFVFNAFAGNGVGGFSDEEFLHNMAQSQSLAGIEVLYPNGGEEWWVGRCYKILWKTKNLSFDNIYTVDLYYSADSGETWGSIAKNTANDGSYRWCVPLYLENWTYWVPSPNARIKAVLLENRKEIGVWDSSDEDFCPPIDYDHLTSAELEKLKELGLYEDVKNKEKEASEDLLDLAENLYKKERKKATTTLEFASTTLKKIESGTSTASTTLKKIRSSADIISKVLGKIKTSTGTITAILKANISTSTASTTLQKIKNTKHIKATSTFEIDLKNQEDLASTSEEFCFGKD